MGERACSAAGQCGRNGGGILWKAWKARPRARQARWGPVRCVGEGADALPTLPTGKERVAAAGVESVESAHASRQDGER